MRVALWFMALFAIAAAGALFAGNNHATVTFYWHPHRVDVSLNLVLLALLFTFLTLHLALRALSALFSIPQQARSWRLSQRERSIYGSLLESLSHLVSGRFVRARKAAELVVSLEESVQRSGEQLPHAARLRSIAHLIAAESAHALQDRAVREAQFVLALAEAESRDVVDAKEGVQLRGARWAIDDRDASSAMQWLDQLPQGAARRTVALRLRFRAARLAGKPRQALDTARLLTKHRAFSAVAGASIARGLAIEMLRASYDQVQIQTAWDTLSAEEQLMPDIALEAAQRLLDQGGEVQLALRWILPLWDAMVRPAEGLGQPQRVRLVRILEQSFVAAQEPPDAAWLARIESAQMSNPSDALLQYIAGYVCMQLKLWGKAQQMLSQCLPRLRDPALQRDAWRALAQLAEQRQDLQAASNAYREAAKR
jgi:HemY protein